jgi:CHAD domain-containing protein
MVRPTFVKDQLLRRIGDASRRLRAKGTVSDQVVHDARKDLKRARATLRLLTRAVGENAYTRENAALRDVARLLSGVRDARVVMDALDELLERDDNAAQRALLHDLRALLEKARLAVRGEMQRMDALEKSAKALEDVWTRVERWRTCGMGASDSLKGLKRVYERGRKALAHAQAERSPECLHEWRKHVKYLAYVLEVVDSAESGNLAKLIKRSTSVADALGDDHDLVVLQEKLKDLHSGSNNAHAALMTKIAKRRKKLQSKALKVGRALYKAKARRFLKRVRKVA